MRDCHRTRLSDSSLLFVLLECLFIIIIINVKNFHGSLATVVRAQNDTSKTANITDTIFDRTLVTSDGVLKFSQIRRSVSC